MARCHSTMSVCCDMEAHTNNMLPSPAVEVVPPPRTTIFGVSPVVIPLVGGRWTFLVSLELMMKSALLVPKIVRFLKGV